MKKYSFLLLIYLFHFSQTQQTVCRYKEDVDGDILIADGNYLSTINETEKKQSCFSLSFSDVEPQKCCYDKDNDMCTTTPGTNVECPQDTIVHNNCGMAGVFQPDIPSICTEISLVTGYCCFVKTNKGNACIRTKKLNSKKNTATDQLKNYVKNFDAEIESVECGGTNLNFYFFATIFYVLFF